LHVIFVKQLYLAMTEKISIEMFQCSRLMQAWLVLCFICIAVVENVSRVEHEGEIIGELY